ncbi:MAG: ankyrin repeat domain-containing protein [Bacteroidia bacterium]
MKAIRYFTLIALLSWGGLALAQEGDTSNVQVQYPFGEKGSDSRGFYGNDDRQDVTTVRGYEDLVGATLVKVSKSAIQGNRIYTWSLRESLSQRYGVNNFDENVAFLDQPTAGSCTGFFIAPDIMATAGHCVNQEGSCEDYVWIVDYTNKLQHRNSQNYIEIDPNDIYECEEIMDWDYSDETLLDYAYMRMNKKTEREPYMFRTDGDVQYWQDIFMIGAPNGLPLKLVDDAKVTSTLSHPLLFVTSLDHFPGNSGGPVFDKSGWIEAIHVRGYTATDFDNSQRSDYIYDPTCNCIKTVSFESYYGKGSYEMRIIETNYDILIQAIYENIEYAIEKGNLERFNKWMTYNWILETEYAQKEGRLELLAADSKQWDMLEKMLELGTSKNITDDMERNLYYYAVLNNNTSLIETLAKNGFNLNKQDKFGESALFYAIERQNVEAVRLLLKYGASVSVASNLYGYTPLHYAARIGNIEIAEMLINKGANIMAKSSSGWNTIKLAKKSKNKAMKKYLKRRKKQSK